MAELRKSSAHVSLENLFIFQSRNYPNKLVQAKELKGGPADHFGVQIGQNTGKYAFLQYFKIETLPFTKNPVCFIIQVLGLEDTAN